MEPTKPISQPNSRKRPPSGHPPFGGGRMKNPTLTGPLVKGKLCRPNVLRKNVPAGVNLPAVLPQVQISSVLPVFPKLAATFKIPKSTPPISSLPQSTPTTSCWEDSAASTSDQSLRINSGLNNTCLIPLRVDVTSKPTVERPRQPHSAPADLAPVGIVRLSETLQVLNSHGATHRCRKVQVFSSHYGGFAIRQFYEERSEEDKKRIANCSASPSYHSPIPDLKLWIQGKTKPKPHGLNRTRKVPLRVVSYNRRYLHLSKNSFVSEKGDFLDWIQRKKCYEIPVSVGPKCQECASRKDNEDVVCRFQDFRRFERDPKLGNAGERRFYRSSDTFQGELKWLPSLTDSSSGLSLEISCYILQNIQEAFKTILDQETETLKLAKELNSMNDWDTIWKPLHLTRETCDVCDGTIFNLHFVCSECGFSSCADCVRRRENNTLKKMTPESDPFGWLFCHEEAQHDPKKLQLASIIPDVNQNVLSTMMMMDSQLTQVVDHFNIPTACRCPSQASPEHGVDDHSDHICFCQKPVNPTKEMKYLCNKNLLLIEDAQDPDTLHQFQQHWRLSLPIIVANQKTNPELWEPKGFRKLCDTEGEEIVERSVQDCESNFVFDTFSDKEFWDGFLDCRKRRLDGLKKKLRLKLKDWPSNGRFAERLPEHFKDFILAVPIQEYTNPSSGPFNLVNRLPDYFLRPDLGPKMYTAYEMLWVTKELGTTNLHLDVSDAVNIMMTVYKPNQGNEAYVYKEVLDHVELMKVDPASIERVRANVSGAGAIWSIFRPDDTEKIRDYLRKNAVRYGLELSEDADPVHDQLIYLDTTARQELFDQYGVVSFTFVQMQGDCVFIPAGAPHQVQNLQCCIKVAEDFVSPEGVRGCAQVAAEFRKLSKDHTNHEDKLQLQSIIYCAVKDSVSRLLQEMKKLNVLP